MPGSVTSAFTEPEDFEAALRTEGCLGLLITGQGRFRARLTQIALNVLRLSATEEELSRVAFLAVPSDMVLLMLPTDDLPLPICGGLSPRPGEIMTLSPGEHTHARTDGLSHARAIWVPIKELVRYGRALTGAPFAVPSAAKCWRPTPGALRNLRTLHAAATRMATRRPQTLIDRDTAHGLEQQLLHAMVECLTRGSADTTSQSGRRHQDLMVRFERWLNSHLEAEIRIKEICATLEISERLLRVLCSEHLGMGPITYDRLRRMWLVRHALRRVNGEATVSAVARRYGFRSPGRFAINYRAAFGETPSTTLRRGVGRR